MNDGDCHYFSSFREVFLLATKLRDGLTTGTCAAAALKAALMFLLSGELPATVQVKNPQGQFLEMPIEGGKVLSASSAIAWTLKDAGDDIDVTHGAKVCVRLSLYDGDAVEYIAGEGVGIAKKPGLFVPVGEPAINPGPRQMMKYVLDDLLPAGKSAQITISVPGGQALAEKTLNPMLGIEGGISIIGTTGIVRPMSEEAFRESLVQQYSVLRECSIRIPILVPGKIGENIALKYGIKSEHLVQTSNFIGFMLDKAVEYGFKELIIFGHVGKLIKLAGGIFHTHSHVADGRQEIFAAYLALLGAHQSFIEKILASNTTEAILLLVNKHGYDDVYKLLAKQAAKRCCQYVKNSICAGVVLVDIEGNILAMDENAKKIGEKIKWHTS